MEDENRVLPYLEIQLTDHCNLNCKGCTHFCPIAKENYLKLEAYVKDLQRLAEIFTNISVIRLMGGEPLLHPQVTDFVEKTGSVFPKCEIHLVTNGILLPKMNIDFYDALKKNNVIIDVSEYPITKGKIPEYTLKAVEYGIPVHFIVYSHFCKMLNPRGDSNKDQVFNQCWTKICTFLRCGKIYQCCTPALAYIFNEKFGFNIPGDSYIDIYTNVTAETILEFLSKPTPTCAYCKEGIWFPWAISRGKAEEWY